MGAMDSQTFNILVRTCSEVGDMKRAESALKWLEEQSNHPSGVDYKLRNVVASGYAKNRQFDAAIKMLESVANAGARPCMKMTTMLLHLLGRSQQQQARAFARKAVSQWKLQPDALFCEALDHILGLKGASALLSSLQVDENLARSMGTKVTTSQHVRRSPTTVTYSPNGIDNA